MHMQVSKKPTEDKISFQAHQVIWPANPPWWPIDWSGWVRSWVKQMTHWLNLKFFIQNKARLVLNPPAQPNQTQLLDRIGSDQEILTHWWVKTLLSKPLSDANNPFCVIRIIACQRSLRMLMTQISISNSEKQLAFIHKTKKWLWATKLMHL